MKTNIIRTITIMNQIQNGIENSEYGKISLKIGSEIENIAFDCSMGQFDELELNRKVRNPLCDYATYSIKTNK